MRETDISVVIPVHPARIHNGMLDRALKSVWAQTKLPTQLIVEMDTYGHGAAHARQRGLIQVRNPWTAFLDSDDEFLPEHLATLAEVVASADDIIMAYSWFEPVGMPDPLGHFGLPFNPATPHHTTITTLVNTSVAKQVKGFPLQAEGSSEQCLNEDWIFLLRMCEYAVEHNQRIVHVPKRTWRWHCHGGNTSGRATRGDAK